MYEELVRDLRNWSKAWGDEPNPIGPVPIKRLAEAADAIEELSKPKWIPVTEEPPLKVGDDGYNGYLIYGIYDGNGYYEVADYTTDKFDNVPCFHVDGEYEPDVTHWMPLPEPPKEET